MLDHKTAHLGPWLAVPMLALSLACLAQPDSEDVIKYRQNYMKALGGHMGSAAQIVRGKVDPEGHLARHAEAIAALSEDITVLFPKGSDFGETEAKPEVWEDWQGFQKAASKEKRASAEFLSAVQGGGGAKAVGASFKALSDACKGCHENYRAEEEE
jgi:cytochrome c556